MNAPLPSGINECTLSFYCINECTLTFLHKWIHSRNCEIICDRWTICFQQQLQQSVAEGEQRLIKLCQNPDCGELWEIFPSEFRCLRWEKERLDQSEGSIQVTWPRLTNLSTGEGKEELYAFIVLYHILFYAAAYFWSFFETEIFVRLLCHLLTSVLHATQIKMSSISNYIHTRRVSKLNPIQYFVVCLFYREIEILDNSSKS